MDTLLKRTLKNLSILGRNSDFQNLPGIAQCVHNRRKEADKALTLISEVQSIFFIIKLF